MVSRVSGFVDIEVSGDLQPITDDDTIGIGYLDDPERLPKSILIDPERLERALIAVREEFYNPRAINIALVQGKNDDAPDIALYPDDQRDKAVVVALRERPNHTLTKSDRIETVDVDDSDDTDRDEDNE